MRAGSMPPCIRILPQVVVGCTNALLDGGGGAHVRLQQHEYEHAHRAQVGNSFIALSLVVHLRPCTPCLCACVQVDFAAKRAELFEPRSVPTWFTADQRLGCLTITLEQPGCFAAEEYAQARRRTRPLHGCMAWHGCMHAGRRLLSAGMAWLLQCRMARAGWLGPLLMHACTLGWQWLAWRKPCMAGKFVCAWSHPSSAAHTGCAGARLPQRARRC